MKVKLRLYSLFNGADKPEHQFSVRQLRKAAEPPTTRLLWAGYQITYAGAMFWHGIRLAILELDAPESGTFAAVP